MVSMSLSNFIDENIGDKIRKELNLLLHSEEPKVITLKFLKFS